MLDPNRAAFVSIPHRYYSAIDLTIKGNFIGAREIEINTQLSSADANALAATILNATRTHPMVFTVETEGPFSLDSFEGSPPMFTLSSIYHPNGDRTFRCIGADHDPMTQTTKLALRG